MAHSLASLRKARELTQEQVGRQIAQILGRPIGASYAQKKIARFEAREAAPTNRELEALAKILEMDIEVLRPIFARAPEQGMSVIEQVASRGRSLMAICMLSKPRPQPLPDAYEAVREAISQREFSVAAFIPYPSSVNLRTVSHAVNNLVGYYTRAINDVLENNTTFKKSLKKRREALAVYVPKPELLKLSAVLIPPIFRQYSLTVQQAQPNGPLTKQLHVWTPGKVVDTGRPIKATGAYSVQDQVDAWQSFFGQVIPHWIEKKKLIAEDEYWKRIL
jgi:transcriptional regulator with XRE-family HTH domain